MNSDVPIPRSVQGTIGRWLKKARRYRVELGFLLGAATGLALGNRVAPLRPLADFFLVALQILGPPLALLILASALASLSSNRLGRLGVRSVSWYVGTAFAAGLLGVIAAYFLKVGSGFSFAEASKPAKSASGSMHLRDSIWLDQMQVLLHGPLPYVVLSGLFLRLLLIGWRRRDPQMPWGCRSVLEHSTQSALQMLRSLMLYAPIGIFALAAMNFGQLSFAAAAPLVTVLLAVYLAQVLVFLAVLVALRILGHAPGAFLGAVIEALMTAFLSGSSVATLPVEFTVVKDKLRIPPALAGVVLPLGLAIHKLGTAVHQAVILAFATVSAGHPLSLGWLVALSFLTLIASVITPPISGGSPVALSVVFAWAGLPFEAVVVTAGIPLLGKLNTPLNSLGRLMSVVVLAGHGRAPEDATRPIAV